MSLTLALQATLLHFFLFPEINIDHLSISNSLCFFLSFAWILISLQETNELVAIKKFKDSEGECRANEGRKRVEEEDS